MTISAARLLLRRRKYDHVTPLLMDLDRYLYDPYLRVFSGCLGPVLSMARDFFLFVHLPFGTRPTKSLKTCSQVDLPSFKPKRHFKTFLFCLAFYTFLFAFI